MNARNKKTTAIEKKTSLSKPMVKINEIPHMIRLTLYYYSRNRLHVVIPSAAKNYGEKKEQELN